MTRDEFLQKLTQYPFDWKLDRHGQIRAKDEQGRCLCPITAVCFKETGRLIDYASYYRATTLLNLDDGDHISIAADNETLYPALRRQLLEACNIRDQEDAEP